jgi:hypothetical protein
VSECVVLVPTHTHHTSHITHHSSHITVQLLSLQSHSPTSKQVISQQINQAVTTGVVPPPHPHSLTHSLTHSPPHHLKYTSQSICQKLECVIFVVDRLFLQDTRTTLRGVPSSSSHVKNKNLKRKEDHFL